MNQMPIKPFLVTVVFFLITRSTLGQTLDLNFNGLSFLDNREYKEFVGRSRTYSGTRIALDIGVNLDSLNSFRVGINSLHEFGAKPFFIKTDPTIYYQFRNLNWQFNAGAFPREGLVSDFPRAMFNDTLRYFRPNIEGLLVKHQNAHGYQTLFIDWISRQTKTDREQFIFGSSGKYQRSVQSLFYFKHFFFLLHDAGTQDPLPGDRIRDNGAIQLRMGVDLTHKQSVFDSVAIEFGGMMSLERIRGVTELRTPKGVVASAYLAFKKFALYDEFYAGQGHDISYGDSYYMRRVYNRIDIIYSPFVFKRIRGQFIFSFHQTPNSIASNQQAFRVTYDLGRRRLAQFRSE